MSDEIDRANEQAEFNLQVALANQRQTMASGESSEWCEACGNEIPDARRKALPGVELCVDCAREAELKGKVYR